MIIDFDDIQRHDEIIVYDLGGIREIGRGEVMHIMDFPALREIHVLNHETGKTKKFNSWQPDLKIWRSARQEWSLR